MTAPRQHDERRRACIAFFHPKLARSPQRHHRQPEGRGTRGREGARLCRVWPAGCGARSCPMLAWSAPLSPQWPAHPREQTITRSGRARAGGASAAAQVRQRQRQQPQQQQQPHQHQHQQEEEECVVERGAERGLVRSQGEGQDCPAPAAAAAAVRRAAPRLPALWRCGRRSRCQAAGRAERAPRRPPPGAYFPPAGRQ